MNKLFSSNPETINKTAFVNWRTQLDEGPHNLIILGEGFINSSLILLDHAISHNQYKIADSVIFPILHNVNHAIELYLKAIEYAINNTLNNGLVFSGGHDILQLLQTVLTRICQLEGIKTKNAFSKLFETLANYINEVYEKVDNVSNNQKLEFSRYPVKKDKRDVHFYIKSTENVEIDLENYKNLIIDIHRSLKQSLDYFYYSNN